AVRVAAVEREGAGGGVAAPVTLGRRGGAAPASVKSLIADGRVVVPTCIVQKRLETISRVPGAGVVAVERSVTGRCIVGSIGGGGCVIAVERFSSDSRVATAIL